jgi:hypothetical protein
MRWRPAAKTLAGLLQLTADHGFHFQMRPEAYVAMDELGFPRMNSSLGLALGQDAQLQFSMATAASGWFATNFTVSASLSPG